MKNRVYLTPYDVAMAKNFEVTIALICLLQIDVIYASTF